MTYDDTAMRANNLAKAIRAAIDDFIDTPHLPIVGITPDERDELARKIAEAVKASLEGKAE